MPRSPLPPPPTIPAGAFFDFAKMSDPRISPTILSQKTITASETVTANSNETGASAWGALTTEQKMSTLSRLLSKNLATAVPQLMQPGASGQPPVGTPAG